MPVGDRGHGRESSGVFRGGQTFLRGVGVRSVPVLHHHVYPDPGGGPPIRMRGHASGGEWPGVCVTNTTHRPAGAIRCVMRHVWHSLHHTKHVVWFLYKVRHWHNQLAQSSDPRAVKVCLGLHNPQHHACSYITGVSPDQADISTGLCLAPPVFRKCVRRRQWRTQRGAGTTGNSSTRARNPGGSGGDSRTPNGDGY